MKKILFSLLILAGCSRSEKPAPTGTHHLCLYFSCPYLGLAKFPGLLHTSGGAIDSSVEYGDAWAIDKLHFEYPTRSYDELEAMIWGE